MSSYWRYRSPHGDALIFKSTSHSPPKQWIYIYIYSSFNYPTSPRTANHHSFPRARCGRLSILLIQDGVYWRLEVCHYNLSSVEYDMLSPGPAPSQYQHIFFPRRWWVEILKSWVRRPNKCFLSGLIQLEATLARDVDYCPSTKGDNLG